MLVPYTDPRRRAPQSLAEHLRMGGALSIGGGASRQQQTRLVVEESTTTTTQEKMLRIASRQARATACCAVVSLAIAVTILITVVSALIRLNQSLEAVESSIRPHAVEIERAALEIFSDVGSSVHNMHELALAAGGTKGSAARALNSSAVVAERLARFLEHPTVQLSLGGSA